MDARFTRARYLYTLLVEQWYRSAVAFNGYGYALVDIAPASLRALTHAVNRSRITCHPFPVWKGGSEQTVFLMPHVNYMFRYLHDHEHVATDLSLSIEDEVTLGHAWMRRVATATQSWDVGLLAMEDTVGQTLYYAKHGTFPADQVGWVYEQWMDRVGAKG